MRFASFAGSATGRVHVKICVTGTYPATKMYGLYSFYDVDRCSLKYYLYFLTDDKAFSECCQRRQYYPYLHFPRGCPYLYPCRSRIGLGRHRSPIHRHCSHQTTTGPRRGHLPSPTRCPDSTFSHPGEFIGTSPFQQLRRGVTIPLRLQ